MRHLSWSALVLLVLLAAPALLAETMSECLTNCPPGVNNCSNCCMDQYNAAAQSCYNECESTENACLRTAAAECNKISDPYKEQQCMHAASNACFMAFMTCRRQCNPQIAGGCPGEVPPQKCPYTCQMWNPASQSCVGAPSNAC